MATYRRKPTEVEAEQWFPSKEVKGVTMFPPMKDCAACALKPWPVVTTIHGDTLAVFPGDWIVAERDGIHYYPVKDEVFKATYDPMPEDRSCTQPS